MRHLCKQSALGKKIGAFLVLDGASTEHITNRALGSRRFEVTFTGPGGHSWSDYGVGNPVHALSRAIALFSDTRLNGLAEIEHQRRFDRGRGQHKRHPAAGARQGGHSLGSNEKMDELVDAARSAPSSARWRWKISGPPAAKWRSRSKRSVRGRPLTCRNTRPSFRIFARWIATWVSAPISTALPRTPTFPCRWAFPPSPSARAGRAAERIPRRSGSGPKAAIWD